MTAHGTEKIAVEAMKLGADDYITKPFQPEEVYETIRQNLEKRTLKLENKRLQQRLKDERLKMESIFTNMANAVLVVDEGGQILSANRATERLTGRHQDELIDSSYGEVIQFKNPTTAPHLLVHKQGRPIQHLELEVKHKRGHTTPVLINAAELTNTRKERIGFVEVMQDISALKQAEQAREEFVHMITHDLKTPITSVLGTLEIMHAELEQEIDGTHLELLGVARRSGEQIVGMIADLLDVYRLESGQMAIDRDLARLHEIVAACVEQVEQAYRQKQLTLDVSVPDSLPVLKLDHRLISRVLVNLLSNALKFTPSGGQVSITAERRREEDRRFVKVEVRDTGIGIPEGCHEKIFDKFAQVETRREGKTRGTGLGLAICRRIIDAHQGEIWADPESTKGSTFRFTLPY
jgi:PAS domain S-box-containing protein